MTRLKSGIRHFLFFYLMLFLAYSAYSQQETGGDFSTQATDSGAKPDAQKMGPKKDKFSFLIKNNPSGTLYGNPCFKEVSHGFGFEYLIVPAGISPNSNGLSRSMHNLGVNIKLLFRNGPFWKVRMKKKFERCKYGYGDFVG